MTMIYLIVNISKFISDLPYLVFHFETLKVMSIFKSKVFYNLHIFIVCGFIYIMIEHEYQNAYLSQNCSARKHPFPIDTQLGSIKYTRNSSTAV